jgi:hypothetical protein
MLALWLGLLALTIQSFAPLCALGLPSRVDAGTGAYSIVLCTAHGFERVQLDADGKSLPDNPSQDQNSTCSLCAGIHVAGGFTAPSVILIIVQPTLTRQAWMTELELAPSPPSHSSYVSRAPPVSTFIELA